MVGESGVKRPSFCPSLPMLIRNSLFCKGSVYVIGGGSPVAEVDRVNVSDGTNASLSPMRQPRFDAAAVASDGRILVFGGVSGGAVLSSCESYEPTADRQVARHRPILLPLHLSPLALRFFTHRETSPGGRSCPTCQQRGGHAQQSTYQVWVSSSSVEGEGQAKI